MTSEINRIKDEILEKGFWAQDNTQIGEIVDDIVRNEYNLQTEVGLGLYTAAVLKNELVAEVIGSLFPQSTFIFYRAFGKTKLKHCILNRTADNMRILIVFCWSSESAGTIYSGSHSHYLGATGASNGLLAIPDESLNHLNIRPHSITMDRGGLAIVDARCGWQIDKGKSILLGFAIPDELPWWRPMPLPISFKDALMETVGGKINMNVQFS
ncbi:hypothetical protein B0T10DRAFT_501386 [Thelonectria olida]|uniref:Uncharacterized protein n=1 Tax=Thelonectria olida TaxID=1576542 RepID=A0A9P9AHY3_9HYPO|nr:hypothetical protein B0T10DRAFT_501386 [Thelonectria olida]